MHAGRRMQTATLLRNGEVLVAGGGDANNMCCVATAEVYNPRTRTWRETGTMIVPRAGHGALLLNNGGVLVVGGQTLTGGHYGSNTAEVYNPRNGTWTATTPMAFYRYGQAETLLRGGKVLITGGGDLTPTATAELFTFHG